VDIQFLVERLEALVVNARKVPMTTQIIIEQGQILDVVEAIRGSIPEEVRQARRLNQESDRVLARARDEAEQIVGAAQEQAALLLQERELVRRAEQESSLILEHARTQAQDAMRGADKYAIDVLRRLESDLETTISTVRRYVGILQERLSQDGNAEVDHEDKRGSTAEAALRSDRGV
jgi:cell division septum initiation protein DivIVA